MISHRGSSKQVRKNQSDLPHSDGASGDLRPESKSGNVLTVLICVGLVYFFVFSSSSKGGSVSGGGDAVIVETGDSGGPLYGRLSHTSHLLKLKQENDQLRSSLLRGTGSNEKVVPTTTTGAA